MSEVDQQICLSQETEDILQKAVREISENRARILDDFAKAYLASHINDSMSKEDIKYLIQKLVVRTCIKEGNLWYGFSLKTEEDTCSQ